MSIPMAALIPSIGVVLMLLGIGRAIDPHPDIPVKGALAVAVQGAVIFVVGIIFW